MKKISVLLAVLLLLHMLAPVPVYGREAVTEPGKETAAYATADRGEADQPEVIVFAKTKGSSSVSIKDANLEAAIRQQLKKTTEKLTAKDLQSLTNLNIGDKAIASLQGLENLTNLEYVSINNSSIKDLSPLLSLKNLTGLTISHSEIGDFTSISKLKNLNRLTLSWDHISNISFVKNLTNLDTLYLEYNDITDITPLAGLVKLEYLLIDANRIKDISPLKKLTKLSTLEISENMICNLDVLKNFRNLDTLFASGNPISDLSVVKKLKKLTQFEVFGTDDMAKAETVLAKINELISTVIKPGMTDYEKELALHDYVVSYADYDRDNYVRGTIPEDSYGPYGILVSRRGVCSGYAATMEQLLTAVGIECRVVSGTTDRGDHAWNIVKLGDGYYQMDATWDDPVSCYRDGYQGDHPVSHEYFNLTDSEMSKDHSWDTQPLPECSAVTYCYDFQEYWKDFGIKEGTLSYIKGKVYLPDNEVAPKGGIKLLIYAMTPNKDAADSMDNLSSAVSVTIPEGSSGMDYSIPVIPYNNEYVVYYWGVDSKSGYLDYGFYSAGAMTQEYQNASKVTVSGGDTEINFNLIKARVIRGTITLPLGMKAGKESISVYVEAYGQRHIYSVPDYFYIMEGQNSCEFMLPLGELENSFRISISTNTSNDEYHAYYYDGNGGSVLDYEQAAWITVTGYDTVINIQLN